MWIRFFLVASLIAATVAFTSEDYKVNGLEQFGLTDDSMYSGYMPLKVCDIYLFTLFSSSHLTSSHLYIPS